MLKLRNFSKGYGSLLVLSIANIDFQAGLHWIKGENGSGKSTLFKSIAGIVPCKGDISIRDQWHLRKHPVEYRKRVNFSEAEPVYPGFLTATDLIRFMGKAKGASAPEQNTLATKLGIDSYIHQSCGTFSSGMLKKLGLTLAFLGSPQVIILDEPFITLDEEARIQLGDLIRDGLSRGILFLISSHQSFDEYGVPVDTMYGIKNKTLVPI